MAARDEEYENATPGDTIVIKKLPMAEFLSRDRQILGGVLPIWFSLNSSAGFLDRTQPEYQTPRFVSRVDVYPEVTTAFHFASFNLTASGACAKPTTATSLRIVDARRGDYRQGRPAQRPRAERASIPPAFERILSIAQMAGRRQSEAHHRTAHRL